MKTKFLFPNRYKRVGWILIIPSAILGILYLFFNFEFNFLNINVFVIYSDELFGDTIWFGFDRNNITSAISMIFFVIGAILVAFSKEKQEDEFIAQTRLESLVWAAYTNYIILIFCILFFYGEGFFYVMIFNMFTILIFFIIRFYYILYITNKSLSHEK